jgi:exonuclease VII large subunit
MAIHLRWFERRDGTVLLAPDDVSGLRATCPPDCIEREANTLAEVDALQRRLQAATYERCQREFQRDEDAFREARERVRSDLTAKLYSAATDEWEKEFIRGYLQLREEKRDKYREILSCRQAYLLARENDEKNCANPILEKLAL